MYDLSDTLIAELKKDNRIFISKIDVVMADTSKSFTISDDLLSTGIEDNIGDGTNLTVGSVISRKLSFTVLNDNDDYDDTMFYKSEYLEVYAINSGESLYLGRFFVDSVTNTGYTIAVTGTDLLSRLSVKADLSTITFPTTADKILSLCLSKTELETDSDYSFLAKIKVGEFTYSESTYADLLAYCLQCLGRYAKINNENKIEFRSYIQDNEFDEFSNVCSIESSYGVVSSSFSLSIDPKQLQVTGVIVTGYATGEETEASTVMSGLTGYALNISENPMIQKGYEQTVADNIYSEVKNLKFVTFSGTFNSDISLNAGDIIKISDKDGNLYESIITDMTYSFGGLITLACNAQTEAQLNLQGSSTVAKTIAQTRTTLNFQNAMIDVINGDISSINDTIDSQNNTITSINNTVNAQNDKITSLNNNVTAINDTVSSYNDTITSQNNKISALDTTVSTWNDTITSQGNDITALSNKVTANSNSITSINNTIVSVNSEIETLNSKVSTQDSDIEAIGTTVNAQNDKITSINDTVTSQNTKIESLDTSVKANSSSITTINSELSTINSTVKSQGDTITSQGNSITSLNNSIDIYNSSFKIEDDVVTGIKGIDTDWILVKDLETDHATVISLDTKYAQIDFANIGEEAVKKLFADSGIIENLVVSEGKITGELVGVTIKGDLIEGNTIVADKLVVKGEDGLFYKLNTDGVSTTTEQTEYNSLNGSVITAKSVTAEKVSVDDLVAFGATIGGFHITENSLYSGAKASADNTTRGVYLDSDGQLSIGDSSNYLKYFKDSDGTWKLDISANSISLGTSNLEEKLSEIEGELTTFLYISSSKGTTFKNDNINTVLSVVVYRGANRITDMTALKSLMGDKVYLQWRFQRQDEETIYDIDSSDTRITNDGFNFTITSDDVDNKATFMCDLMEED